MPEFKSLADRQADRERSQQLMAERKKALQQAPKPPPKPARPPKPVLPAAPPQTAPVRPPRPWATVRVPTSGLRYSSRSSGEEVWLQPWSVKLVNTVLQAAEHGGTHLCLVWPAKLDSVVPLHAAATLERVAATDLRGIRTLLYPGTHATRAALQAQLANRDQLAACYCSLFKVDQKGPTVAQSWTTSPSFLAALDALNDVRHWHPEVPFPSLAELVPVFVFDDVNKGWQAPVHSALERTLAKVERRADRQSIRKKVSQEWQAAERAPSALLVLHHTTKKDSWKAALKSPVLGTATLPEVLLLDASSSAQRTHYNAVYRIPAFLRFADETQLKDVGRVVVTDDPKTFFVLRAQLAEGGRAVTTHVLAAEAAPQDALFCAAPAPTNWVPALRTLSNFSVGIVDEAAAQAAHKFQKLANEAGSEDTPVHQALVEACLYILRMSNMPAGYQDLTAFSGEEGANPFMVQKSAWTYVDGLVREQLALGSMHHLRQRVEAALAKAAQLIDDWKDATPMASRLLTEVSRNTKSSKANCVLVMPSSKYVELAQRYLSRKLGEKWAEIERRIEWHTLSTVGKTLATERKGWHFVFVGVNPDVLRLLVAHPDIPHGTAVLVAYKQAESALTTLTSMKTLDELKPYKGRMGLLAQELEKRIREVPDTSAITRLIDRPLTFKLEEESSSNGGGDAAYYRFELEGGKSAYAAGWVYKFLPDKDPAFRRVAASSVKEHDFIFDMSDELKLKVEETLVMNGPRSGARQYVDPLRMFLRMFHERVQGRCQLLCSSEKRSVRAREIHARMVELDAGAKDCRVGRVYYWLDMPDSADTRPHASKDKQFFKLFCRALDIEGAEAEEHWKLVRSNRLLNQHLGRELTLRYAEVLFQQESAQTYRKVSEAEVKALQQEALRCVFRVERVVPPQSKSTAKS